MNMIQNGWTIVSADSWKMASNKKRIALRKQGYRTRLVKTPGRSEYLLWKRKKGQKTKFPMIYKGVTIIESKTGGCSASMRGHKRLVANNEYGMKMLIDDIKDDSKRYNVRMNIGHAKYVVNSHDGKSTHSDGSRFFDIRIFKNKPSLAKYEQELARNGYHRM